MILVDYSKHLGTVFTKIPSLWMLTQKMKIFSKFRNFMFTDLSWVLMIESVSKSIQCKSGLDGHYLT